MFISVRTYMQIESRLNNDFLFVCEYLLPFFHSIVLIEITCFICRKSFEIGNLERIFSFLYTNRGSFGWTGNDKRKL